LAVTIKGADLGRARERAPVVLFRELHHALEVSGHAWHRAVGTRIRGKHTAFPGRSRKSHLSRRSGTLARSLSVKLGPSGKRNGVAMTLSSKGTSYAATQEFGGIIRPVSAKRLWIPMPPNLTPAGVPRKTPRALMRNRKRIWFGEKMVYSIKGRRRKDGSGEEFVPMFALLKSVKIPGPRVGTKSRFGFFDTWEKQKDERTRRFQEALAYTLREAGK